MKNLIIVYFIQSKWLTLNSMKQYFAIMTVICIEATKYAG